MVGDGDLERVPRRDRPSSASTSETSRTFAGERRRPLGVRRVVAQQLGVLLHRRAAAGRVDHDARPRRPPRRRRSSRRANPCASASRPLCTRQRAAAALRARHDHVAALGRQHPRGGGVDAGEERPLHAAGQHADPAPRAVLAPRCARAARSGLPRSRGGEIAPSPASCGASRSQQPGALEQRRSSADALVGAQRPAAAARSRRRVREQREDQLPERRSARLRRSCAPPAARVASISLSYCTPDGQAVTQAMQPRHASKCCTIESSAARPRGPASSGRSGPAGSPSPRPTARRSGRSAGRSRSARSRRSARRPAGGARRRCRGRRACSTCTRWSSPDLRASAHPSRWSRFSGHRRNSRVGSVKPRAGGRARSGRRGRTGP